MHRRKLQQQITSENTSQYHLLRASEFHITQLVHEATRMSANAQRDGRPAEYRWRPLFNAAKFG